MAVVMRGRTARYTEDGVVYTLVPKDGGYGGELVDCDKEEAGKLTLESELPKEPGR